MQVTAEDIRVMRLAMADNPQLMPIYRKMAEDVRPRITPPMQASFRLVFMDGKSCADASVMLGVSRVTVSFNLAKCLARLVDYERSMGRDVPEVLSENQAARVSLPSAKRHGPFFLSAFGNYQQLA